MFTFVKVALPPTLEYIHARRLAATTQTSDGVTTYRKLFEDQAQTVLDQHFELENRRRSETALLRRNELLSAILQAHGIAVPPGEPPQPLTARQLIEGYADEDRQ